jgi:hypothetical protein
MDEAFHPFSELLRRLTDFGGGFTDAEAGVHTYITGADVDTPVELSVSRDADGKLQIGSTPPIYALMTSVSPSYHRLSFRVQLDEAS